MPGCSDELLLGYRHLAAGILHRALDDWTMSAESLAAPAERTMLLGVWELAAEHGFSRPRDELLSFFHSAWAKELCRIVDLDHGAFLARMGIPSEQDGCPTGGERWFGSTAELVD